MRPHADDLRAQLAHDYTVTGSFTSTARKFHTTAKAVRRVVRLRAATGSIAKRKPTGRPRVLGTGAAAAATELLLSGEYQGAAHVAQELHSRGLAPRVVHKTTVIRRAREAARLEGSPLEVKRGPPAKELTPSNRAARLEFAKTNKKREWRHVMFTDRKRFLFKHPGVRVAGVRWLRRGDRHKAYTVNHPMCVNVYAGITIKGVTACHVVTGTSKHTTSYVNKQGGAAKNITAAEYGEVVTKTFLREGSRLLGGMVGGGRWVLQQDNDPTHRAAVAAIKQWNKVQTQGVTLLEGWPPNSPDLNLIENVWAWVQARVNARGCTNFDSFKQAVLQEMAAVPQHMLTNLYASMGKRLQKVIDLGGGRTGY